MRPVFLIGGLLAFAGFAAMRVDLGARWLFTSQAQQSIGIASAAGVPVHKATSGQDELQTIKLAAAVPSQTVLAQAEAPSTTTDAPAAPPPAPEKRPKVDETALRYFTSKGDTRRLETEIARLRALYPDWAPPANPLEIVEQGDPQLDNMWKLYSENKYAELRKAIADREAAEPAWQVPADLLDRLAIAESREQLINASDLKQYEAVIRLGSATASLLTCGDVDVLWRVAEAFALTDRRDRASDAYLYVLKSCEKPEERLATMQKAAPLLARPDLDALLATERKDASGRGEFQMVRDEIARQALAVADADPDLAVAQSDIDNVKKLTGQDGLASDDLLLGWYYVRRDDPRSAEDWFRKARAKENTAAASQGLALALIDQERPAEAEDILFEWRDTSDDVRNVYLAAAANLLAVNPPPPLTDAVLQRMVQAVVAGRDPASAQQLGWYADGLNQFKTAEQWFATALQWKPDDEPAAYGLALMRWKLGDSVGVSEVQIAWAGRSERIPTVGQPSEQTAAVGNPTRKIGVEAPPVAQPLPVARAPAEPSASQADNQPTVEQAGPRRSNASGARGGCATTSDPSNLSSNAALTRGWCLLEANRPVEAAEAFEVALQGSGQTKRDAAYGQSLAYLRAGLSDMAAVSATKAPLDDIRRVEIQTGLLAAQATSAYEQRRYTETLVALDELARIAPERNDLMILRGYAYLGLGRYGDAEHVFRAVSATGDRTALKGLSDVKAARNPKAAR